jgi:hypothetical protein
MPWSSNWPGRRTALPDSVQYYLRRTPFSRFRLNAMADESSRHRHGQADGRRDAEQDGARRSR